MLAGDAAGDTAAEDSAGAGIGVRVFSRLLQTGRFDLEATARLITDPDMVLGAIGGVVGYTVAAQVATAFMPPGMGVFARMLPRFLGAALGFELARGRLGDTDPAALLTQALVSTGGYTAVSLLLGSTAPGWLLMAGATVAGVLANLLIRPKAQSAARPEEVLQAAEPGASGAAHAIPASGSSARAPAAPASSRTPDDAYRAVLEAIEQGSPELEARYQGYARARLGP